VSSGEVVRHRLSRAGDRQLNFCLHVMAIAQVRHDTPGRAYYLRKRSEGKNHNKAMRCLKRRLSKGVDGAWSILSTHPGGTDKSS
jgi:transposase